MFAFIALIAHESLEQEVLRTAIRGEVAHVMEHVETTGSATVETDSVNAFLEAPGTAAVIPEALRKLELGEHSEIDWQGRTHFVTVSDVPEGRLVIAADISLIDEREREYVLLVVGAIVVFLFLAWRIGRRVAASLADPLEQLSSSISTFVPGERRQLDMTADAPELQKIIKTFNEYAGRMGAFIEREQNLTAMTSHELRTPLAVIRGAADVLLSRGTLDESNLKTVQRLQAAAISMSQSVDAILWLAREDSPSFSAEDHCDPGAIASKVVAAHLPAAERKGLDLSLSDSKPMQCRAPAPLVEILISNLVRNAIAYTERGAVNVAFDGSLLSVTDTGPGVPPEMLAGLVRAKARGTAKDDDGCGYGLYTVNQICVRFGWLLSVSQAGEKGSCFQVNFLTASADRDHTVAEDG